MNEHCLIDKNFKGAGSRTNESRVLVMNCQCTVGRESRAWDHYVLPACPCIMSASGVVKISTTEVLQCRVHGRSPCIGSLGGRYEVL